MAILEWILQYKWIIIFYLTVAILIFINRKKWQIENKFILIYRTKWGIKTIDRFADKHKELVKVLGYCAIGIGFVGMIVIVGFFIKGLYDLIFVPSALPTMSLVIPGVQVPGSPIFVPFWYGIIALFIVVAFHEFGHGIVARAHGIPVKNTGLVFFGPLPGAFVEPDEKKIMKSPSSVQVSMFAAGPFFNAILAAIVAMLLFVIINPLSASMVDPSGVKFTGVQQGYPAQIAGIQKDQVYTTINGEPLTSAQQLQDTLLCAAPNSTITLGNSVSTNDVILTGNPSNPSKGYMGVTGIQTDYQLRNEALKIPYNALFIFANLLEWIFMLSLGIGLANLLPLGPVDGGRMLNTTLVDGYGKEKGTKIWMRISLITFIVLLILVIVPILKSVLFKM